MPCFDAVATALIGSTFHGLWVIRWQDSVRTCALGPPLVSALRGYVIGQIDAANIVGISAKQRAA